MYQYLTVRKGYLHFNTWIFAQKRQLVWTKLGQLFWTQLRNIVKDQQNNLAASHIVGLSLNFGKESDSQLLCHSIHQNVEILKLDQFSFVFVLKCVFWSRLWRGSVAIIVSRGGVLYLSGIYFRLFNIKPTPDGFVACSDLRASLLMLNLMFTRWNKRCVCIKYL